jgi:hypothetical protein
LAEQEKDLAGAEKLLHQAVALEETLPIAFGPPAIDQPTHELLGEFLLRHDRADVAQEEFKKALARTPGRRQAERGFGAASAGALLLHPGRVVDHGCWHGWGILGRMAGRGVTGFQDGVVTRIKSAKKHGTSLAGHSTSAPGATTAQHADTAKYEQT